MRTKNREKLLNASCRFGQNIRKLVVDGAPSEDIHGLEINSKFIDLGYDFFRGQGKLRSSFIISDILGDSEQLAPSTGKIDILVAIKLMHFWNWEAGSR